MEFHRTRTLRLWIGFGSIVLGLFGAFEIFVQWQRFVVRSGWFYQHMTRDFSFHGVAYFLPLLIPVGIYVLVRGLGPFHRRIDEYGVTVENDSANMRIALPWQGIAAMSIERKPGDSKEADPYLVLWPIPGTNLVVKESYVLDGRPAYALVQLDELKESVDQLSAALRQYAGPLPSAAWTSSALAAVPGAPATAAVPGSAVPRTTTAAAAVPGTAVPAAAPAIARAQSRLTKHSFRACGVQIFSS